MKRWPWKRIARAAGVAALAGTLLLSGALAFGIAADDLARVRAFAQAARNWQENPDYRNVADEYATLGSDAMATRALGMSAEEIVMGFRSLPGLPRYLSAHVTSTPHYRAFSSGELAAYLHLTGEQGVADGVNMIEDLGRRERLSDEQIVGFLRGFKLPLSIATDQGAVAGVRRLLADVDAAQPFSIRGDVVQRLRPHIQTIAAEAEIPADVETMTRPQQKRVFHALDDHVKQYDQELWRTKQVSDFLGGIWAAGYGQIYVRAIEWMLRVRLAAQVMFVATVGACAWIVVRRVRSARQRPRS